MEKEIQKKKKGQFYIFFLLLIPFCLVDMGLSESWAAEGSYPDRPINMIVPYAPGGGSDMGSKIVATKISEILGQPIISLYKPGGGGTLGTALAAKAKPDGYTIVNGSETPLVLSPILKKLDYKLEDFVLIGAYAKISMWFAVKADARWKTLKDFVEEAKKFPGKLQISSYGKLTQADFIIELLCKYAEIKLTHVPYKSSAEALTAVMGGHADAGLISGTGGLFEAGSIRILAAAEEQRLEDVPDIPTFKEFGYPIVIIPIYSYCFPKGTPQNIIEKFRNAQQKAFERYSKEIKENLRKVDMWVEIMSPEDTLKRLKKDHDLFYKMAEALGAIGKQ